MTTTEQQQPLLLSRKHPLFNFDQTLEKADWVHPQLKTGFPMTNQIPQYSASELQIIPFAPLNIGEIELFLLKQNIIAAPAIELANVVIENKSAIQKLHADHTGQQIRILTHQVISAGGEISGFALVCNPTGSIIFTVTPLAPAKGFPKHLTYVLGYMPK